MDQVFILTIVDVRDPDAFARYRAAIAGLNDRIGGTMLIRGRVTDTLEGDGPVGQTVVAIGFPDADAARAYIASPEYQAAKPLREAAGEFRISLIS